jgi:hypothetical protein
VLVPGLIVLVAGLGLPTVLIDAYNASDISNRRMGPGFPWTISVSAAEQEGAAWLRRSTPADAVVQMEPVRRGRTQWSFIPSFAQRRMGAGLPISLLPQPEYRDRSAQARRIFTSASPAEAHRHAQQLGVDYVWLDGGDRKAFGGRVRCLDDAPEFFEPVFRNAEVTIFAVR